MKPVVTLFPPESKISDSQNDQNKYLRIIKESIEEGELKKDIYKHQETSCLKIHLNTTVSVLVSVSAEMEIYFQFLCYQFRLKRKERIARERF